MAAETVEDGDAADRLFGAVEPPEELAGFCLKDYEVKYTGLCPACQQSELA